MLNKLCQRHPTRRIHVKMMLIRDKFLINPICQYTLGTETTVTIMNVILAKDTPTYRLESNCTNSD